jgi:hypothetical protein
VTEYPPENIPQGVGLDLLRVLESDASVRADVIRQFHERGNEGMVDLLADLEADDLLRLRCIAALRRLSDS